MESFIDCTARAKSPTVKPRGAQANDRAAFKAVLLRDRWICRYHKDRRLEDEEVGLEEEDHAQNAKTTVSITKAVVFMTMSIALMS